MLRLSAALLGLWLSLGMVLPALAAGHDNEIILLGKSESINSQADDRFIYKLNGIFVAVSPGDIIDGCVVNRIGQLICHNQEGNTWLASTLEDKSNEIAALSSELTALSKQYENLKKNNASQQQQLEALSNRGDAQFALINKLREVASSQAHQLAVIREEARKSLNPSITQIR